MDFKIDTKDGSLIFLNYRFSRGLTCEEFQRDFQGKAYSIYQGIRHEVFATEKIGKGGLTLCVQVHFHFRKLEFIEAHLLFPDISRKRRHKDLFSWFWSNFVNDKKNAEEWLTNQIGENRIFHWGRIKTVFDKDKEETWVIIVYD